MDTNKERSAELDGFRDWMAGRNAAAATIDMQTCDL